MLPGILSGTIARYTLSCHGDPTGPSPFLHPSISSELVGRGRTQAMLEHVAHENGEGQFLLEELAEMELGHFLRGIQKVGWLWEERSETEL